MSAHAPEIPLTQGKFKSIIMEGKILFKVTFLCLFLLGTTSAFAQVTSNNNGTQEYRITAYKNGDPGISSQSNVAEVVLPMTLYVPNSFTPNNDGLNDTFGAKGDGVKRYHMLILNQWGEIIFESNNINNKWDGTFKGKKVPPDVYIYQISAYGNTGGVKYLDGNITLVN